ncbi:hypothetical protein AB5I41_23655 [Sphingomonas sp. MMS24-JH45]
MFGQVLLVAVAVVVTVATKGALAKFAGSALGLVVGTTGAAVAGGALAGTAESIASQGVGLATGLQDRFSFKGVALAALGGAVGGGLGAKLSGGGVLGGIGRGVLGSVGTQGLAVATVVQPARLGGRGDSGSDRRGIVAGRGHPGADGVRAQDFGSAAVGCSAGAAARSSAVPHELRRQSGGGAAGHHRGDRGECAGSRDGAHRNRCCRHRWWREGGRFLWRSVDRSGQSEV